MPWETLDLEKLAKKLGIDYLEVKAKHDLITKIKSERKKHQMTQSDLAKLLGRSQAWVAKVESGIGTKRVTFETLFKILAALGFHYKITTKKVSDPQNLAA